MTTGRALHDSLQAVNDPLSYAENLSNLPVFCVHGSADGIVRVEHARDMVSRLRALGAEPIYHEFAGYGHWGFPNSVYDERWRWMLSRRREKTPGTVRFKTARLRYGGAYWLRIDQFEHFGRFAEVRAEQDEHGTVHVESTNVAELTILPARLPYRPTGRMAVRFGDGELLHVLLSERIGFARTEMGWDPRAARTGRRKRSGLEGPVEDAFQSPFILVPGTVSTNALWRHIWEGEAARFADDWERLHRVRPLLKADIDVTDEDIHSRNLVLYGGPMENAVAARVWPHIPVRLTPEGARVGDRTFSGDSMAVRLCYPNPLNPERYVVLSAAASPSAAWQLGNRFGNFTGWGPMDNWNWFDYAVVDARTQSPDTMVCAGFFGRDWRIDPEAQWSGDPARRRAVVPRVRPRFTVLPAGEECPDQLWVSDLLPCRVDQHRGTANIDRSHGHRPLRIGTRVFRKGFGVRAPSVLEFKLGGHYSRFRSSYGFDLEGERNVDAQRGRSSVQMQFLVHGDGKRLWSSEWLPWNRYPPPLEVDIRDVDILRLEVKGGGPIWLFGSTAWGDAQLLR